jgi:hypothetical protein
VKEDKVRLREHSRAARICLVLFGFQERLSGEVMCDLVSRSRTHSKPEKIWEQQLVHRYNAKSWEVPQPWPILAAPAAPEVVAVRSR